MKQSRSIKPMSFKQSDHRRCLALLPCKENAPYTASRGRQIEIVCADHLGRSYPERVYQGAAPYERTVISRAAFHDFSREIIANLFPAPINASHRARDFPPALGDALYELFKNTHEHARTDVYGNELRKSIRGFQVKHHALFVETLEKISNNSPPLAAYCRQRIEQSDRKQIQLIEVSIFYSGPGMGARWFGKKTSELSVEDELQGILNCFHKHFSSKKNSGVGLGLSNVTEVLRRNQGFMRLRTGRHSLYTNLHDEKDREYEEIPTLTNWSVRSHLAIANGTLFTFLLPLERDQ